MIDVLMEKGNAYRAADGSVYFKVSSFEDYGGLSRVKERELKVGARSRSRRPTPTTRKTSATSRSGRPTRPRTATARGTARGAAAAPAGTSSAAR
jgi:hypothetical protein